MTSSAHGGGGAHGKRQLTGKCGKRFSGAWISTWFLSTASQPRDEVILLTFGGREHLHYAGNGSTVCSSSRVSVRRLQQSSDHQRRHAATTTSLEPR
jgi:hypothetical protein